MNKYRQVTADDFEVAEDKYKRLYIGYNEVMHLLSLESFEKYVALYHHIYIVFTQTGSFFVVQNFVDVALAVCRNLPELEAFYGNFTSENHTEEAERMQ